MRRFAGRSQLSRVISRRYLVILFVLLGGCAILVRSDVSTSFLTLNETGNAQETPNRCSSCPPPSAKRIYAPAIELREAERCEIVLNSRSANPIDVTPIFYTVNGDAVVMNPVQLQPAEIRFIPVEQLMPEAMRGLHRWGGIALSYTGNVLEVWAQITFHGVGGGSVDETFNILEETGSDTREAVWWMPGKSTAVIALGNSSNVDIRTTAQFSDGETKEMRIPSGATRFIRQRAKQQGTESVKLTTVGPEGSMRVMGFVVADDNSFTSSIRFNDTKRIVQPNLYATNLRLGNANARIVIKNTGAAEVSAQPRFYSTSGESDNPVELPAMTLRPQQIAEVDLRALKKAAASRSDFDSVSVQIHNSGAPGSLIGAAYSSDKLTDLTYDVPLRDSGATRNLTGSYPWRIDDDYSTIVSVTNVGAQSARFQVEIRYTGGPYSLKPQQLEPGQTATFDLRKMRDEQTPDRTGKLLTVDRGQFHWSVVATPGEARLIGRAEVVSRSTRLASSYSCPVCCPDSGPTGGFYPSAYEVPIGGFTSTGSQGVYTDCYGNTYPTSLWWTSLSTYSSTVATFSGESLYGEAAGSTYAVGTYDYIWWDNFEFYCQQNNYPGSSNAPTNVAPAVNYKTASIPGSQDTFEIFGSNQTANLTATESQCNPQSNFVLTVTFWLPQETREVFEVTMEGFGNTSVSEWNVDQGSVSHSTNLSVTPRRGDVIGTVNNKNGGQTGTTYNAIQINVKGKYNSGQTFTELASVRIDCP